MPRIVEDIGSYHAVVAGGEALESKLRQGYMPSVDIRLDGSMDQFISHYNGQYYMFAYGDWSQDVEMLGGMIGMKVILNLHVKFLLAFARAG